MNILGINFGHDCSATLISNGKLVSSMEEEKISRVKQDFGWPVQAISVLLQQAKLQPGDIDVVAFGSQNFLELSAREIRYRFQKNRWRRFKELASRVGAYYGLWQRQFGPKNKTVFEVAVQAAGFLKARVYFFEHHLAHAASAWYAAPFAADLVVTCDGHGDGSSLNYYLFDGSKGLTLLETNDYQASIGQFYSAITQLLGFRPTRHEGKITGLAAFGKHTALVDVFHALFGYDSENNLLRYPGKDASQLWDKLPASMPWKTRVNLQTSEAAIGLDYARRGAVLVEQIKTLSTGFSKEDIAFACQKVTEMVLCTHTTALLQRHFPQKKVKLALAGGVFANVRVNQLLLELEQVDNLFIQPAMGDAGLSLGGAILASIAENQQERNTDAYRFQDAYWGPDFSQELEPFLATIHHEAEVRKMENPALEIAQMLCNNTIIGLWQGNLEWGPRALGHRSIILNTFDKRVNDTINQRLSRTEFMPFAPSVIDYMAARYFPEYNTACPAADFMTITYAVAPEFHNLLQAVVHVDGTARPQMVRRETAPYYYAILDEFYRLSGCGAIVNTSFNAHEEPIVSTPQSAYKALKDRRIDVLVLEDYLVKLLD